MEEWFWEMPVCTRWWTAATLLASGLVQCRVVSPFQLFYSFGAVFKRYQVSRDLESLSERAPSVLPWQC